jgi:hypothetical protein
MGGVRGLASLLALSVCLVGISAQSNQTCNIDGFKKMSLKHREGPGACSYCAKKGCR